MGQVSTLTTSYHAEKMQISRAGQNLGKLPAESRLSKVRENASHDADYDLRRSGDVCSEEKEQIWSEWPPA